MIVSLIPAIGIPIITGFFLVHLALPNTWRGPRYAVLKWSLASGAGFGLTSCMYFTCLALGYPSFPQLLMIEGATAMSLAAACLMRSRTTSTAPSPASWNSQLHHGPGDWLIPAGFHAILLVAVATFLYRSILNPCGGWDAWGLWNLFARFIYRGGVHWKDGFTNLLATHHPDYPLLLATSVARGWKYLGKEAELVPIAIAFIFTFSTVGLLVSSLTVLKCGKQGLLAGIALLGTPTYIILGSFQYADVPLGYFFLSTFVLLGLQDMMPENPVFSFLAGIMAGLSSWTKNEGLLFLISILAASSLSMFFAGNRNKGPRQLVFLLLGIATITPVVFYFKTFIAPPNDVVSDLGTRALSNFMDPARYLQIAKSFVTLSFDTIPLFALVLFYPLFLNTGMSGCKVCKSTACGFFAALAFTLTGYFIIYLITPHDLAWHLESSMHRLLLQLWPSAIFSFLLISRFPEDALTPTESEA
ncbi:MAG: hypothetical protein HYS23_15945 [Geobacter sp.]|nr:hypothetical protein [Geobacter sp.]